MSNDCPVYPEVSEHVRMISVAIKSLVQVTAAEQQRHQLQHFTDAFRDAVNSMATAFRTVCLHTTCTVEMLLNEIYAIYLAPSVVVAA